MLTRCSVGVILPVSVVISTRNRAGLPEDVLASIDVVTGRVLPASPKCQAASSQHQCFGPCQLRTRAGQPRCASRREHGNSQRVLRAPPRVSSRSGCGSRFPAAEDNDLCFRVLEDGGRIHYVPEAVVVHRAWRSARTYNSQRMMRDILRRLGRAARYARHPRRAVGEVAYAAGVIVGAAAWTATSSHVSVTTCILKSPQTQDVRKNVLNVTGVTSR